MRFSYHAQANEGFRNAIFIHCLRAVGVGWVGRTRDSEEAEKGGWVRRGRGSNHDVFGSGMF